METSLATQGYAFLGKVLGHGSFSTVVRARHASSERDVAVKVIDKSRLVSRHEKDMPRREVHALRRVGSHPHAVQLLESFEDSSRFYLVLELAERSLADVIAQNPFGLPEREAARIARELLLAVRHVHEMDHLHLDIAPRNVLLDVDGAVKLADFGMSRHHPAASVSASSTRSSAAPSLSLVSIDSDSDLSAIASPSPSAATLLSVVDHERERERERERNEEEEHAVVGTLGYVAPEVVAERLVSPQADAWSVGVVVHELVTGTTPVFADTPACAARATPNVGNEALFPGSLWDGKPPACQSLVRGLLLTSHNERTSIPAALESAWLLNE